MKLLPIDRIIVERRATGAPSVEGPVSGAGKIRPSLLNTAIIKAAPVVDKDSDSRIVLAGAPLQNV